MRNPIFAIIVPMILVLAALVFIFIVAAASVEFYFDLPSLIVVPVLPTITVCLMFGARASGRAFSAVFDASAERRELATSVSFFETLGRAFFLFGMIGFGIGLIIVLSNLNDTAKVGPNLAVALLCVFYAAVANAVAVLPFLTAARTRMIDAER